VTPEIIGKRAPSLWRYREFLPVGDEENTISLGEGFTPLVQARCLGSRVGLRNLWVKDESQMPTGSFKARGLYMAMWAKW
jgi:threonine synthase